MRLDKYIASTTDYSRNDVKRLLKAGFVTLNQKNISDPSHKINPEEDIVELDGETLASPLPRYFMLNKPINTVCATEDSEHPTVLDLMEEPRLERLQIVGRLDKDTTGLVLLTDDGQWNHRVSSPKKQCFKHYQVKLARSFTKDMKKNLEDGILLNSETKITLPAQVKEIDDKTINLAIQEGRYHQVKRMLAAVGNHVIDLHRFQIGDIVLDESLSSGEYRHLTADEVSYYG